MTVVVSQAGPWVLLTAVLYVIYRWCQHQDRREAEAEARWRLEQTRRYREAQVRTRVYDQERDAA